MRSYQSGSAKCPECGALVDVYPDKLIPDSAGLVRCTKPGRDPLNCPNMHEEVKRLFGSDRLRG